MKKSNSRFLDEETRREFGVLILLDQIMRYDHLKTEKEDLKKVVIKLEGLVEKLNKGFFKTEDQEEELNFQKEELDQAQDALFQIEKEMIENEKFRISIALVEKDEERLEPFLKFMEERNILTISDDNYFQPTEKGRLLYHQLVEQLEAYVKHFEIYTYVDLENGLFGDPNEDLLEGDQWADLRLAVAEYKGIDPNKIVFLAMLAEEKFFENPDWKFDLGLGTLFDELEKIVKDQIDFDDLGYEYEGEIVNGEDVIRDIISQGEKISKERIQGKLNERKNTENEYYADEKIITKNYYW